MYHAGVPRPKSTKSASLLISSSEHDTWDGLCVWRGTQEGDSQAFSKAVRGQMEEHQMKTKCPCLHFADCNL